MVFFNLHAERHLHSEVTKQLLFSSRSELLSLCAELRLSDATVEALFRGTANRPKIRSVCPEDSLVFDRGCVIPSRAACKTLWLKLYRAGLKNGPLIVGTFQRKLRQK